MGNYIFYTPKDLAELLLRFVPQQKRINSVIDICCGSWNLLSAGKARYPNAKIVGVDIDETLVKGCLENAEFVHSDGREYADSQVKQNLSFDLILSNPPFGALKEDEKKYAEKGNALTESKRYEAEMLWANYQLMNSNSIMIIILPSTYSDNALRSREFDILVHKGQICIAKKADLCLFCEHSFHLLCQLVVKGILP